MFSALFLGKHVTQQIGLATLRCGYKSSISLDKLYPKSSLDFLQNLMFKWYLNLTEDLTLKIHS